MHLLIVARTVSTYLKSYEENKLISRSFGHRIYISWSGSKFQVDDILFGKVFDHLEKNK